MIMDTKEKTKAELEEELEKDLEYFREEIMQLVED
jgi:hypothetical protein